MSPSKTIVVHDAMCCTKWPMLLGVRSGRCGICGEVPVGVPNTTRVVEVPETHRAPKLVATVAG